MEAKHQGLAIAATVSALLVAGQLLAAEQAVADPPAGSQAKGSSTQSAPIKTTPVDLAGGSLTVSAPAAWLRVKPRNRIIEVELAVPAKPVLKGASGSGADGSSAKGSSTKAGTGRLTIMAAGGSVDANISRWIGQFKGTGAGVAKEKAKIEKREVAGMTLHTLDISGTYMDSMRGPFGPKTPKPDHRMLAGILQTKDRGNYFFKMIGPASVVAPNADAFTKMLDSARVKK